MKLEKLLIIPFLLFLFSIRLIGNVTNDSVLIVLNSNIEMSKKVDFLNHYLIKTDVTYSNEELTVFDKLIADNTNNTENLGYIKSFYGRVLYFNNRKIEAEKVLEESFDHLNKIKPNNGSISIVCQYIGAVKNELGKNNEALNYYFKALKAEETNKDSNNLAVIYANISNIYFGLKLFKESNEYIKKSVDIFSKIEEKEGLAGAYLGYGINLMNIDKLSESKIYITKSLQISTATNNVKDEMLAINNLGILDELSGDYDAALIKYNNVKEYNEKNKDTIALAYIYSDLGSLFTTKKDYPKAIENFQKSLYFYKAIKNPIGIRDVYSSLSSVYKTIGNYKKAFEYTDQYYIINDSINNLANIKKMTEMSMGFQHEKDLALKEQTYNQELKRQNLFKLAMAIVILLISLMFVISYRAYNLKKRTNILISKQNENLEILNATKDKLFGIIGHDLRKPATSFNGITKKVNFLIKENDFETLNKFGNEIEKNANELNNLIDNLLGWSMLQKDGIKLNPQKINLFSAVAEVLEPFQSMAKEKNITIHNEISIDNYVEVDEQSLYIILRNLIHNALKFTNKSGNLYLNTSREKNRIKLIIRDTGIGMTNSEISEMFNFHSASTKGTANEKGTGLGMFIIGQWSKLNNIKVNTISEKGVGTTFELVF